MDKEINRIVLRKISFHLLDAMQLCSQLDLSGIGSFEQKEWNNRIKLCKNALEFTKDSAERLSKLFE